MALPTEDHGARRTFVRQPDDNRHSQLRSALGVLHRAGHIRARHDGRNRFEGFSLLNEAVDDLPGHETSYTWPGQTEPTIAVPVEFFINGWVHALADNEIITFLYLLYRSAVARAAGEKDGWVQLTAEDWAWAFGGDRGFEAHRHLVRYGLVDVLRPDERRADGTVAGGGDDETELPSEAHWFRVDHDGLAYRAVPAVVSALKGAHAFDLELATWFRSSPDGWTRVAAIAANEQAALAAPSLPTYTS